MGKAFTSKRDSRVTELGKGDLKRELVRLYIYVRRRRIHNSEVRFAKHDDTSRGIHSHS